MTTTIILLLDPTIWGTISDWVMVLVTVLTLFFLYRTLQSQKDVQKMQNELFRIESVRFKESIKPTLKYSLSKHSGELGDNGKRLMTLEVTNETNSLATNISKHVTETDQATQIFIPMSLDDHRDHLTKGDKPLLFHFAVDKRRMQYHLMNFKYQDIAGTKYQQRVICIHDENFPIEIHPSLPETITTDVLHGV
jgi:hypothetical protein